MQEVTALLPQAEMPATVAAAVPAAELVMAQHAVAAATYADFLALPDNVVGELIDGVLYTQPRPAPNDLPQIQTRLRRYFG